MVMHTHYLVSRRSFEGAPPNPGLGSKSSTPSTCQLPMKRPSVVSYSSSSDEEGSNKPTEKESLPKSPVQKRWAKTPLSNLLLNMNLNIHRKKLPPISSSLVAPRPLDNPALHQGRIRTTPHVEGQFTAHVYVSLALGRHSMLYKVLQDILRDAKEIIPTLHDIWSAAEVNGHRELHISLSRPIFLWAHQREDLKRAVKNISKAHKP